ncbi:MAG TPA: CHASE2 domain-containing protein [Burkholderiaceae bacterium]|nr:CHASE2 domain-containing protein [Burkholderiaceae bacterium]
MTGREAGVAGAARIRIAGTVLLAGLALLMVLRAPWTERLQAAWFDLHQGLWPRPVSALPVTVVEIDARSLKALGQWPWARSMLAHLVDSIAAAGPAAVALDILMPEADALSPDRILSQGAVLDRRITDTLRALPSNDAALGDALRRTRTVLAVAGLPEAGTTALRSAPVVVRQAQPGRDVPLALTRHEGALSSIDVLDRNAGGWGLISVDPTRGVVRRMPLVASVGGTLVPALSIELLRVAQGASAIRLWADGPAVRGLQVGGMAIPTEADGAVRPWFSPRRADRFVSAVDVLQGRADATQLRGQIVIVGPTALALGDYQDTPLGQRMPGSEIHAQLIENLVDGTLLQRPSWAAPAELALLLAFGGVLLWAVPRWRPYAAGTLALALIAAPMAAGALAFRGPRWLLDAATPGLNLALLFLAVLLMTLAASTRQRRALEARLQDEREQRARMAGELDAAQRIQTGSLPRLESLAGDQRLALHARLTPAREVGGDLYEFFMLDADRLFVMVGDVSGKGLPASIFMAVSKALCKSTVLRSRDADVADLMRAAEAEIARDNAQMLFVTAFAAVLDLRTGVLQYCNAGHDNPYLLQPGAAALERLVDGDGPPLCAMEGYPYASATRPLRPGQTLLLMTDGVTEARDVHGALFGTARVDAWLAAAQSRDAEPRALVEHLHAAVQDFAHGTEPADDLTLLALRWHGRPA